MKDIKYHYLLFLSIIMITAVDISDSMFSYYLFLIILSLFVFNLLLKSKLLLFHIVDTIPMMMIFLWLYGLNLGILYNNDLDYITRNFAGLLMYLLYFVTINLKINNYQLLKLLVIISTINVFIAIYYGLNTVLYNDLVYMESGQARLYFLGNMTTYYIVNSWSFFNLFGSKCIIQYSAKFWILNNKIFNIFLFIISSLAIILPASKGFILAYIVIIFLNIYILFIKNSQNKNKINKNFLFIILFLFLLFILFIKSEYINLIFSIFNINEVSNSIRNEQFYILLSDLSFFGKGLGATVLGNQTLNTYGFELIYINIIHKFGIFALIIYISFYVTILLVIKISNNIKYKLISIICLSCMAYLIPSLGNPMLLAPINVVLHTIVLVIIRNIMNYPIKNSLND